MSAIALACSLDLLILYEPTAGRGAVAWAELRRTLASLCLEEGLSFIFLANPDYFLGEPHVERIEYRPMSGELLALRNGDIDAASPSGRFTDDVLAPFRESPCRILEAPGEWHMALFLNLELSPLDDVSGRRALAHALDRQGIVDRVLQGRGLPGG